ncbi:MAG: hypothetical protein MUE30_07455 [Spirosomaceae bacterium]|jgi:hypothetical protein|nr:hypothetical protein [Spirosomataceae bacterium]
MLFAPPDPSLSKTSYLKGLQCEKQLYLYKHHYDLRDPLTALEKAKFQGGHDFEDRYRSEYFPNAFDVEKMGKGKRNAYPTLTRYALEQGYEAVLEATFVFEGVLVMNDVLVRESDTYQLQEIKNSSHLKNTHIQDAALQYFVTQGALKKDLHVKIVLPDGSTAYQIHDVTPQVQALQEDIKINVAKFRKLLGSGQIPDVPIGAHCDTPYKCSFWGYCRK